MRTHFSHYYYYYYYKCVIYSGSRLDKNRGNDKKHCIQKAYQHQQHTRAKNNNDTKKNITITMI